MGLRLGSGNLDLHFDPANQQKDYHVEQYPLIGLQMVLEDAVAQNHEYGEEHCQLEEDWELSKLPPLRPSYGNASKHVHQSLSGKTNRRVSETALYQ